MRNAMAPKQFVRPTTRRSIHSSGLMPTWRWWLLMKATSHRRSTSSMPERSTVLISMIASAWRCSFTLRRSADPPRTQSRLLTMLFAKVEASGVPCSISIAYWAKGEALAAVDPHAALQAYQHALAIAQRSGNRLWENVIGSKIATLQAHSGDANEV